MQTGLRNTISQRIILMAALAVGWAGSRALAEDPYVESRPRQGWFSFFSRPAKSTPEEQFRYAVSQVERGNLIKATKAYRALVRYWPDSPYAPLSQYEFARLLDRREKFRDAFDAYRDLLKNFSTSYPYDQVVQRMFDIGCYTMNHRRGKFLFFPGFAAPERAVPMYEDVIRYAPGWAQAAETQFLIGQAYEMDDQYEMAIAAFTTAQYRYPDSPYAEKAAFARALNYYRLAKESPNDSAAADAAWAALTVYANTFPAADNVGRVSEMRDEVYRMRAQAAFNEAVFYDKLAHKPKAAALTYRRFLQDFPRSDHTAQAEKRIEELAAIDDQKPDEEDDEITQ